MSLLPAKIDVKLNSRIWYDVGVIGQQSDTITTGNNNNFNGSFITNTGAQFTFNGDVGDHLLVAVGVGVLQPAIPQPETVNSDLAAASYSYAKIGFHPYVTQAKLTYFLGDKVSPMLKFELGQFPYHYNKDSRNLGNYLFRGPVYPGLLTSGFHHISNEHSIANTTGALIGTNVGGLSIDLIIKSETDLRPIFDWSLGAVASYNFADVFEIGAGVNFYRAIAYYSGNTDLTDESLQTEMRGGLAGEVKIHHPWHRKYIHLDYTEIELSDSALAVWESTGMFPDGSIIDSSAYRSVNFRNTNTVRTLSLDTSFYSLRGTKVMGRFAFDAKPLLGLEPGNDYKLYSEVALIGVRDYPGAYENKSERIPVMFGINLPTFGFLDVFNIEVEWYGAKFRNDTYKLIAFPSPSPLPMSGHPDEYNMVREFNEQDSTWIIGGRPDSVLYDDFDPHNVTSDDIKWSVFLSKTIRNHIDLSFQLANDHYRPAEYFSGFQSYATPFTEIDDWYTAFRIGYHF